MTVEFTAWPKTPRLFRDCVITEKIDGTNSAIGIFHIDDADKHDAALDDPFVLSIVDRLEDGGYFGVYAQSRNRLIKPGKQTDNYGFAAWVQDNAATLVNDLGAGLHFGEWWGRGIARSYGLEDRRLSLFNVARYRHVEFTTPDVDVVPVLFEGAYSIVGVMTELQILANHGSRAAPGFMRPEGVIVFHSASRQVYKALIENDDIPKGEAA